MSAAQYLRDLLRPLGVYDLAAPFNGGELDAAGLELDGVEELLEEIQRETCLTTAESWGPEKWASLFVQRPISEGGQELAAALGRPAAHQRGQLYPGRYQRHGLRLRHPRPGDRAGSGTGAGHLPRGGRRAGGLHAAQGADRGHSARPPGH